MRCPAEIYSPSSRRYEGTPDQLDYPDDLLDRRVNAAGQIKLHGMAIAISTALRGWNVGLKPRGGREYALYFARLCLGRVDLSTESFHPATNEDLRCDG
ncbi:MAG: hypothetical protein M5R36_07930 [Deltaproteobacteria bacterium]|nr:hypothetical protein [Deltaproteobacteria bacterium]